MSNVISFKENGVICSNGLTDVLLTVIGLSGTRIAGDNDEKNMIVWLMQKDQSCVGIGTVGFDIRELPWRRAKFDQQRSFLLQSLEGALNKLGWETLDYQPNETILFPVLESLQEMIIQLSPADIDERETQAWINDMAEDTPLSILTTFPVCPNHLIFESIFGCIACNDK